MRDRRVFLADGNAFFNRPGPRLVESAEILAEILHPDECDFGHRGVAYVAYEASSPAEVDQRDRALCAGSSPLPYC